MTTTTTTAPKFQTFELTIPAHWLSAIINGDETGFDYDGDEEDYQAYLSFCENEIPSNAIIEPMDDESEIMVYHDARDYGVLACDVVRCLVCAPID
jgi:hypothetical protein